MLTLVPDTREQAPVDYKGILEKNKNKNFVDRIINSKNYPVRNNSYGSSSTHLMSSAEVDGKNIVYPTLVYDKTKNNLYEPEDPVRHALTSGEFISFDKPEEAKGFAEGGYKVGFQKPGLKLVPDKPKLALVPDVETPRDPLQNYAEGKLKSVQDPNFKYDPESDFLAYKKKFEDEENRTLGDKAKFALDTGIEIVKNPLESARNAGTAVFDAVTRLPAQALIAGAQTVGLAPEDAGGLTARQRMGSTVAGAETAFDIQMDQLRRGGRYLFGKKFSELTPEEQRIEFYKDANARADQEFSKRGMNSATQALGFKPEDVSQGEAEQISGSFYTGPLNAAPFAAGRLTNVLAPSAKALAGTKLAKVAVDAGTKAKQAVGSTVEGLGKTASNLGGKTMGLATNPLVAGIGTLAVTGNPWHAAEAAAFGSLLGKRASRAVSGVGNVLAKKGEELQGLGQQELFKLPKKPGVFDYAGQGLKKVALSKEAVGAYGGLAFGLPFMKEAETPEEAAEMAWNFGIFGALGGTSTRKPLQAERLRQAKPFIDKAPKRYGTTYDIEGNKINFDDIHERAIEAIPEEKRKGIQAQRGFFDGAEIYVVDPGTAQKLNLGNISGLHMKIPDSKGVVKPVILMRQDLIALGHEQGHALLSLLPDEVADQLKQQVEQTYGPEAIQATKDYYNKSLVLSFPEFFTEKDFRNDKLSPDAGSKKIAKFNEITQAANPIDEIVAENLGAIQRADALPVSELNIGEKLSNWYNKLKDDEVSYSKLGFALSPEIQTSLRDVYDGIRNGDIPLKQPEQGPAPTVAPIPEVPVQPVQVPLNTESQAFKDARQAAYKLKVPKQQVKEGSERAAQKGLNDTESVLKEILAPSAPQPLKAVPAPTQEGLSNLRITPEQQSSFQKSDIPRATEVPPDYQGLRVVTSRVLPGDVTIKGEPRKQRSYTKGKRLVNDPTNPTPKELEITQAVAPEQQPTLATFEDLIANKGAADIVYLSAEKEVPGMALTDKERKADFKAEEEGKISREPVQKNIVPTNIQVTGEPGSYTILLEGYSPDKAIANAKNVLDFINTNPEARAKLPEIAFNSLEDIAPVYKQYKENHQHGYRGDGGILLGKDGTPLVKPDPNFTPHKLSEAQMQFMNLIDGPEVENFMDIALINEKPKRGTGTRLNRVQIQANKDFETAKTERGKKSAKERYEKGMQFEPLPNAEVNALRTALDNAGFKIRESVGSDEIISPTVETIRLDRVQSIKPGIVDISPGNAVFQKAGFMPDSPLQTPVERFNSQGEVTTRYLGGQPREKQSGTEAIQATGFAQTSATEQRKSQPGEKVQEYLTGLGKLAEKTPRILERPEDGLLAWAASSKNIIDKNRIKQYPEVKGGHEHQVYVDSDNGRFYKILKKGQFGLNFDPIDYLNRMDKLNQLAPGLDIKFEGVINDRGWPSIVTSMDQVKGEHPYADELQAYLKTKGFKPGKGIFDYEHPSGVILKDAHPANFIKRADGEMIPIDIDIEGDVSQPLFPR